MKTLLCLKEQKKETLPASLMGHFWEMSEKEFWLTVKRIEELFLPFDVGYVAKRRRTWEEVLSATPLFHPLKCTGGGGWVLFLSPLISIQMYMYQQWHKKTPQTSGRCVLLAYPAISLSGLIIMRYFREIPGLQNWCITVHYYLLLQRVSLQDRIANTFWYFMASIHSGLFQIWWLVVAYTAVFIQRVIHNYWQSYLGVESFCAEFRFFCFSLKVFATHTRIWSFALGELKSIIGQLEGISDDKERNRCPLKLFHL